MRLLPFVLASFALAGCFVDLDPDDPPPPTSAKPAQQPATPTPASTAPAGTCAPNALCGGVTNCTDNCYGTDCCQISCSCGSGDDRTHLYCTMQCYDPNK